MCSFSEEESVSVTYILIDNFLVKINLHFVHRLKSLVNCNVNTMVLISMLGKRTIDITLKDTV